MSDRSGEDILCIHYYFPPLDSSGVLRNQHFATAFSSIFKSVHVLTTDNHQYFKQKEVFLPENFTSYAIPTIDYRRLFLASKKKEAHRSTTNRNKSWMHLLLKIQKSFPFNLLLAEGGVWYIFKGYRQAKRLIQKHPITTIYSSFSPYADHYIAYLIKRKFPTIQWVADFRDLQVEPIYQNVVFKGLQRWMERKVLSRADHVTSVSQGLADQLKTYGRPTSAVIRGMEARAAQPLYDAFTISYTGSLYFDYRDPSRLFEVVRLLADEQKIDLTHVRIQYAGRDGAAFHTMAKNHRLETITQDLGLVNREEALTIQSRSHINFLLTSSSPELTGVITGKTSEYIESGRPIVALIKGVKDEEMEALLDRFLAGIVAYDPPLSDDLLYSFILDKYREWSETGTVKGTTNLNLIKTNYSWSAQAQRLLT